MLYFSEEKIDININKHPPEIFTKLISESGLTHPDWFNKHNPGFFSIMVPFGDWSDSAILWRHLDVIVNFNEGDVILFCNRLSFDVVNEKKGEKEKYYLVFMVPDEDFF